MLRKIERAAYPPVFRQLQECRTWRDVKDYAESDDIWVRVVDGYYVILGFSGNACEVVDLASVPGSSATSLVALLKSASTEILSRETIDTVTVDMREITSYRALGLVARVLGMDILEDTAYGWGGEVFHSVVLTR